MSQEHHTPIYSSLNQNTQRFYQQPLYPKFFQDLPQPESILPKDSSLQKKRHQIFDREASREKSVMDFGPFEGSMTNGILKEALTKEIKENIDSVKEDLLESFRRVLDNFRQESEDLNLKIESIEHKNSESDTVLDVFDSKMHDMRGKLKDITNKLPNATNGFERKIHVPEAKIQDEVINKMEQDFTKLHQNIKKSLFDQKENIQKYFSSEIPSKHSEKIVEARQNIEKSMKTMKDMNKGWDQKTNMIKEQLDRKFKVSESNITTELQNLEKTMNFDTETEIFNELEDKMQKKFKELRVLVDEMNDGLVRKLNCQDVERFCSEMNVDEVFGGFLRDFMELGEKLRGQKAKFGEFKLDLNSLIEESKQKLYEILRKKGEVVDRKQVNFEKTYARLQDYQSQLDKFEPLLDGLSGFCQKFKDFEVKIGVKDKKLPELKEEIKNYSKNMENFVSIIEEMRDTQEHFTSKLDIIWSKFTTLQNTVQTSHTEFFTEIENFHKYPDFPAKQEKFNIIPENPQKNENSQFFSKQFDNKKNFEELPTPKLKTPVKSKENIPKSPFETHKVLKSPLQKPLDVNSIRVQEYLSPESFRKHENIDRDMKITSSPVMNLNINAFALGKSPLGAETRALVNQNKMLGLGGDMDNLNNRFSSFGGKIRGISMNYERLSDMGFKNCEETGFKINDEGLVMGADGNVILDGEGNPIKLLPEYMDFLSQN